MTWLKINWRWTALNLAAMAVLAGVLSLGSMDWNATDTFDPMLESGKWAIRFLLVCLTMTPLKTYAGWSAGLKLRKPAGLWAFGFAVLHVGLSISETGLTGLEWPLQPFIILGLLGLLILTALALTSHRRAMQRLGKGWKRLHRLVYPAGGLVAVHALLATTASKRMFVRDPQAIQELTLYLGLLVVLLVVRLAPIRRLLKQMPALLRPHHPVDVPIVPVIGPDRLPLGWPRANGWKADLPLDHVSAELQLEEEGENRPVAVSDMITYGRTK